MAEDTADGKINDPAEKFGKITCNLHEETYELGGECPKCAKDR